MRGNPYLRASLTILGNIFLPVFVQSISRIRSFTGLPFRKLRSIGKNKDCKIVEEQCVSVQVRVMAIPARCTLYTQKKDKGVLLS